MAERVHGDGSLQIYRDGAARLRIRFASGPIARVVAAVGAPLALALAAAAPYALRDAYLAKLVAVQLVALAIVLAFFATYSYELTLDRVEGSARLRRRLFGVPFTSTATIGHHPLVEVISRRRQGKRGRVWVEYAAHLQGEAATFKYGPWRHAASEAEEDAAPVEQFFREGRQAAHAERMRRAERAPVELPQRAPTPPAALWTEALGSYEARGSCPLCREPLAPHPPLVRCASCRTGFHTECAAELGRCSTIGCVHQAPGAQRA